MIKKFDIPPIWTAICILCIWLINHFWPNPNLQNYIGAWLGIILILYAIYIVIWSARTMQKAKTPIHPGKTPKSLVRQGPYAISRNPIYTSMLVFSAGIAFLQGSIYGFLPVFALFFILRNRFVEPEEQLLIATFGEEGQSYVKDTRRW